MTQTTQSTPRDGVPHSSARNTAATQRSIAIAAVVIAFLMVAIWVPW